MRSFLRVAAVIVAIPIGAVVGFVAASFLFMGILQLQGTRVRGNYDIGLAILAGIAAVMSATLLPMLVWNFIQPASARDNGKVSKLALVCLLILGCLGNYAGIVGVTSSPKANWCGVPIIGLSTVMILIVIRRWAGVGRRL